MDHLVVWLDDEIEYELALLLRISSLDCERVRSTFIVWSLAGEAERSIFSVCQRRFVPQRGWWKLFRAHFSRDYFAINTTLGSQTSLHADSSSAQGKSDS
jgi:hypothetical protein